MKNPLTVHSDSSESLHYNLDDFPLYTHKDELYNYDYQALVHWHLDLEYIYIVKGTMDYFVNGHIVTINEGDAIFVNSQRLHYGFSKEHHDCTFIALVISPEMFINITSRCKEYFNMKFGLKNTDYIPFYHHVEWHQKIIQNIIEIQHLMEEESFKPLTVIFKSLEIISITGDHIDDYRENNLNSQDQMIFLELTHYISNHYSEKITLDILSRNVGITRNKCCELFNRFLNDTPNSYITKYRINKSVELLKNSYLSILEISDLCGFSSPSYFTSVFTKIKGMRPKDYRFNSKT